MGKKRTQPAGKPSFSDRLAKGLTEGNPGELAAEAPQHGLTGMQFNEAFTKATALLLKGPDPRNVAQLPALFQLAFLKRAADEKDPDQINDLFSFTQDKEVKKEAKRLLHHLQSRGVAVSIPEETPQSMVRTIEDDSEPLDCYVSPLTGNGSSILWLARYVRGGVAVYQGEVHEENGLESFNGGVLGRGKYRQISWDMLKDSPVKLLSISYAEARKRLSLVVQRARSASKPVPQSYLEASEALPEVQDAEPLPTPEAIFPRESFENETELAREAKDLLELPEFGDWYPETETLQAIDQKLKEVETSNITINDQQKIDQVEKAFEHALGALLETEERRKRYQHRLLTMAVYLQRTDKPDQARKAAAAAWQLTLPDFQPSQSAFFETLIHRVFNRPEEIVKAINSMSAGQNPEDHPEKAPQRDPGSLIVMP